MKLTCGTAVIFLLAACVPALAETRTVWLDELDLGVIHQGWGTPQPRKSVKEREILMGGKRYERGVGSHAPGSIHVELDGNAERFQAVVGLDDEVGGQGSATIKVFGDGKLLFESAVLKGGNAPVTLDLDVSGLRRLTLIMGDAGDGISYDNVDWADAKFIVSGESPKLVAAPREEAVILTPPPPASPEINGPRIFGVTPGAPFIYRIPATGERPMRFAADGLPAGLALDPDTGIITGRVENPEKRTWPVTFRAENGHGAAAREFHIVVGDTLALTPPMGWNHWYAHYDRVTDAMMREAADIMVSSGMADAGYMYVNIDDCWMNAPKHRDPKRVGPLRDENGVLVPNQYFPDMAALADYIHGKGLRAGIYISPGKLTCAGFAGSYGHEALDAKTFSDWGYDFLKYDWCSYSEVAPNKRIDSLKKPYIEMSALLRAQDRDMVFNLCQYGWGSVWKWGEEVGGHCWRTAGDLGFELTGYHDVARRNAAHHPYARPGAWNDPDYLQIGYVGAANVMGDPVPCPLTPNEQYSYMSLWCLMAAPLVYSGDMTRLDPFTLNVLCNPEVIDIDQDPLGKQGFPVVQEDGFEVWTKPLEDGSLAVGLFNTEELPRELTLDFAAVGLKGKRQLRDLWRRQDLGEFENTFTATIPRHGVCLLRVCPAP
ncbi:MAG: NPCBM/NEW2 domain-containing protein [Candidatus Hydrogenedentes bacterium]|nr:NPCBM/NEW2 domain-containing protein [Candidatus Hydrogenedentota bacterium]